MRVELINPPDVDLWKPPIELIADRSVSSLPASDDDDASARKAS